MTLPEYWAHILEVGMGWLGLSYQEAMSTPIPAIRIALRGRLALFRAEHGVSEKDKKNQVPLTAENLRALMKVRR